jgi:hypothetical protein
LASGVPSQSVIESAPAIGLPKGGGALRAIGESFSVNAATGTTRVSLPLPLSPARALTPTLSLTYDSGNGSGPFGQGWKLGAPCIFRRTDHGLPRYQDEREGDIFCVEGLGELVPLRDADGILVEEVRSGFRIRRYRPRIEGSFALIERWIGVDDSHWRIITQDNITSIFGSAPDSRVAQASSTETRIYAWLIEETFDDRGNRARYEYKREDDAGVQDGPDQGRSAGAQLYLKRVRYGNRTPDVTDPASFMFDLIFDYGEHAEPPLVVESAAWSLRLDPFSTFRPGFELRTRRLCRRVLMFHHFPEQFGEKAMLTRSLSLAYSKDPATTLLLSGTVTEHALDEQGQIISEAQPTVEFDYSLPATELGEIRFIDEEPPEPAGRAGRSQGQMDRSRRNGAAGSSARTCGRLVVQAQPFAARPAWQGPGQPRRPGDGTTDTRRPDHAAGPAARPQW